MPDDTKKKDLKERILRALENLVTLEVVTAVGQVAAPDAEGKPWSFTFDQDPKAILSRIDLLQGDVRTCFHEEFVTGDYQSLRDFHAAREAQGHEIIKGNIAALKELLAFARQEETSES